MKNSKNSAEKKIPVYINNDKATFGDVRDLIINPTPYRKNLISVTQSVSAKKRCCTNNDRLQKLDNVLNILEEDINRFIFGPYDSEDMPDEYHFLQEFILFRANQISNVKRLKDKLTSDHRTFSCFFSNRADSLIAIFKIGSCTLMDCDYDELLTYYQYLFLEEFKTLFEIVPHNYSIIIPYDPEIYVNYDCVELSIDIIDD